jgi:hypothetical protein
MICISYLPIALKTKFLMKNIWMSFEGIIKIDGFGCYCPACFSFAADMPVQTSNAIAVFKQTGKPKQLLELNCGHFKRIL